MLKTHGHIVITSKSHWLNSFTLKTHGHTGFCAFKIMLKFFLDTFANMCIDI